MFKDYADIKIQIKYLEAKAEELRESILNYLHTSKDEKQTNEYGTFSIGRRNNWIYSSKLTNLKEEIKAKEIDEQEKNIAKLKVTEFINYKEPKNDQ